MNDRKLIKDVAKGMVLLLLAMLACKYTMGGGAIVIALIALAMALTGRIGWAIAGYCLFPFMVIMNPYVLPKTGITGEVLRLAPMVITIALLVAGGTRPGKNQIPLGIMWVYLLVAGFCSITGYYPLISYLKIINCAILFIGLQLGFRNINQRPKDLMTVRRFLLVLASFVIWGSIAVWLLFPGAAYMTSVNAIIKSEGMAAAEAALEASTGIKLFAGVTNQSQCLATILPCSMAWLACDMFFVEKRLSRYHVLTILVGFPLVYMTRSRSALLTTTVVFGILYFYTLAKINIKKGVKRKLRTAVTTLGVLIILACVVMEVRNQSISKWLRKSEDLGADDRSLSEAFTASRQGKVDDNLADFRSSPIFGTGFQVTYFMKYAFAHHEGLILSASLEKSILPLMVLGETGVVGAGVFLLFIITFYATCIKKRYYCCATLHTAFLATNMAEATYFSPGGVGGILWVLCVGGGFIIDMVVLYHRRMEAIARQQQIEMMRPAVR